MPRTFEEQVVSRLDAIYQGALFLCASDERAASRLVTATAVDTAHALGFDPEDDRLEHELTARLVSTFLQDVDDHEAPAGDDADAGLTLFEAAGLLQPRARAAVWLVHVMRWEHDAAATALGVDHARLVALLAEGTSLTDHVRDTRAVDAASEGGR